MEARPATEQPAEPSPAGAPAARVLVLGTMRIERPDGTLRVAGVHRRRLLAYLASRVGQAVPAEAIIDALWDDDPPPTAAKTLQSHVARLRASLGALGTELIETTPAGYRLTHAEVDADVFERLAGEGHRRLATRDVTGAVAALEDAIALWHGDPYADFPSIDFAVHARTRLVGIHRVAVEDLAEARLESGAVASAAADLERLVAGDPGREHAWALLMRALYARGGQQDALVAFQRARRALAEHMGLEPGPELRELERRVLAHDAGLAISQRAELPAALRNHTDPLVGREVEQAWLAEAWDAARRGCGQFRVLTGAADSGRTRIVAQLAAVAAGDHASVVYVGSSADLGQTLAGASGASPSAVVAVVAERSRRQPVLLVVDDAEWASVATIEALTVLATEVERLTALLVCIVDASAGGPAAEATRRLDPGGARTLTLGPLADDDIVRIAALEGVDDPGAQAAVASVAAGLPGVARREAAAWAERVAGERVHSAAATSAGALAASDEARDSMVDEVARLVRARARRHRLASAAWVGRQPYLGLAAYGPAEADVFVGRERLVAELAARMLDRRFVVVTGASGSGKSSLVRAGLVPLVQSGRLPGGGPWRVTVTTPGADPLGALGVVEEIDRPGAHLLVIDQFEEALAGSPATAEAFVAQLVDLALDPALDARIVLVVRADQYQYVAEVPPLVGLLDGGLLFVGRPSDDELRRIVVEPAERAGCRVEPALVEAVITDVGVADGALPLVSATLAELWEGRAGDVLTLEAYALAGGLAAAVERLGARVLGDGGGVHEGVADDTVRGALLMLADVTEDGSWVRRRAHRTDVPGELVPAFDALVAARLVVRDGDDFELVHEVVFRAWSQLSAWLEAARVDLTLGHDLRVAARAWDAGGRVDDDVWRGARLAAAIEWSQRNPEVEGHQVVQFVAAGAAVADRRRLETEAQLAREQAAHRRLRRSLTAACLLLAVTLIAATAAFLARREAADQRDRAADLATSASELADKANEAAASAQRNADVAAAREADAEAARNAEATVRAAAEADRDKAEVARLVAESERSISGRLDLALLLAVEARRHADTTETRGALLTALTQGQPEPADGVPLGDPLPAALMGLVSTGWPRVYAVDISGDGGTVMAYGQTIDGRNELAAFDVASGRELRRFALDLPYFSLDPTGTFAFAGDPQSVRVLALRAGTDDELALPPDVQVTSVDVSPDGTTAAVLFADRTVAFYATRSRERLELPSPSGPVGQGAFNDAGAFAYGDLDPNTNTISLEEWDAERGIPVSAHVLMPTGGPWPTAYTQSPDGSLLVGVDKNNGTVDVWDVATGKTRGATRQLAARARAVFVSDHTVALGRPDGSILLYDLDAERAVRKPLEASGGDIWALAVSADRRRLVSVADDGLIRVWGAEDRGPLFEPVAPGRMIVDVSADGSTYLLASPGEPLEVRAADDSVPPIALDLPPQDSGFYNNALSYDGSLLTQAGQPNLEVPAPVRVVDIATGETVWSDSGTWFDMGVVGPGDRFLYLLDFDDEEPAGLTVVDLSTGRVAAELDQSQLAALGGRPSGLTPTADGRYLDADMPNGRIVRFDAETLEVVDTVDTPMSALGPLAPVPGTDELFAGGTSGVIASVDMATGHIDSTRSSDPTSLFKAALSPDGSLVASFHPFTASIALFEADSLRPLGRPIPTRTGHGTFLFAPDGDLLASGPFGVIRIELDPDVWQQTACRVAGRNLTRAEWAEYLGDQPYRATCPEWAPTAAD